VRSTALSLPPTRLPTLHAIKRLCTVVLIVVHLLLACGLLIDGWQNFHSRFFAALVLRSVCWCGGYKLLVMEYQRYLPQSLCGLRLFWLLAGMEVPLRVFWICHTRRPKGAVYVLALLVSSMAQMTLAVLSFWPTDLPMDMLPMITRLLQKPHYASETIVAVPPTPTSAVFLMPGSSVIAGDVGLRVRIVNTLVVQEQRRTHIEFKINVGLAVREGEDLDDRRPWVVRRGYHEFENVHKSLLRALWQHPRAYAQLPHLPPKMNMIARTTDFLDAQRRGLDAYLQVLVGSPANFSEALLDFLEVPQEWRGELEARRTRCLDLLGQEGMQCEAHSDSGLSSSDDAPARLMELEWHDDSYQVSGVRVSIPSYHYVKTDDPGKNYVTYDVVTMINQWDKRASQRRRYREFERFEKQLREHVQVTLQPLPPKMRTMLWAKDRNFHQQRRQQLETWLSSIVRDPACRCPILTEFLGTELPPLDNSGTTPAEQAGAAAPGRPAPLARPQPMPSSLEPRKGNGKRDGPFYDARIPFWQRVSDDDRPYVLYTIEVTKKETCVARPTTWTVTHRYREFHDLHRSMEQLFRGSSLNLLPDLPPKGLVPPTGLVGSRASDELINDRRKRLEAYLRYVLAEYDQFYCRELATFLGEVGSRRWSKSSQGLPSDLTPD